ncbi:MAG: sigma-70 family RNA polymerase sigma factor [Phycisphaerales bacterium]|nr:MAG: sigma-70 family RNA polymerase sigma factor [Phycisphaerales bacterium]
MAMKTDDYTRMGGSGRRFPTTHWTAIDAVQPTDDTRNRLLVEELIKDYWKPVYCYLRRKGYGNEEAKDLTQGFFQEAVLGRKLIQRADPTRGRFRTLILTALDRYLANAHRSQTAKKRIPGDRLIPLDLADDNHLPQSAGDLTCEESFNYAWVSTMLDSILEEVEAQCRRRSMAVHWKLFKERVLQPIFEGKDPPSLAEVCARCGIDDPAKASNMIISVKRRLRGALKRHVRQSVVSDAEISEEMQQLAQFLARK